MDATRPEMMNALFSQARDFAHLPILIFMCDSREIYPPCPHTTIHFWQAYLLVFSYSDSYLCHLCSSQGGTYWPGREGGALVNFRSCHYSHMQDHNLKEDSLGDMLH